MGVPGGIEGSLMSIDDDVVDTALAEAAALTNDEGAAAVSADHAGDEPDAARAGPPAFTAAITPAGGDAPVPDTGTVTVLVPVWATVTVADSGPVILGA